jgi:hypothetical protein
MTNQQHPITPSPELRRLWAQQVQRRDPHDPIAWLDYVRPKPPSLKDQALEALERMEQFPTTEDKFTIRRALEALND